MTSNFNTVAAATRIMNSRKSAANHTYITLPSNNNTTTQSTLSKAEQRRKEQFDRSL